MHFKEERAKSTLGLDSSDFASVSIICNLGSVWLRLFFFRLSEVFNSLFSMAVFVTGTGIPCWVQREPEEVGRIVRDESTNRTEPKQTNKKKTLAVFNHLPVVNYFSVNRVKKKKEKQPFGQSVLIVEKKELL